MSDRRPASYVTCLLFFECVLQSQPITGQDQPVQFIRGDCNADGQVTGTVSDALFLLQFKFLGGPEPQCLDACDANGDGHTGSVTDAIFLLNFNFLDGQKPPPAPFPDCGVDPAAVLDPAAVHCKAFDFCPQPSRPPPAPHIDQHDTVTKAHSIEISGRTQRDASIEVTGGFQVVEVGS